MRPEAAVASLEATAYTIPTDAPEADGTLEWRSTTLVVVEASAAGAVGLGYTYAHESAARFAARTLAEIVVGRDALSPPGAWREMVRAARNTGLRGVAACAISAVDAALWDLKAKLLGIALVDLLGMVRESVPVYGSGGFTSYDDAHLRDQLASWIADGCSMVKMKIGGELSRERLRLSIAREAIGEAALFVDANGAYTPFEALAIVRALDEYGVRWFEEPVSSDDLDGLRLVREQRPGGMAIAAGEYGFDPWYFERMLAAGAVDVLQADATRCLGVTGFVSAASQCEAKHLPLSAHTAPGLHLHLGCALAPVAHLELFHDHARIERALFEGWIAPERGRVSPDRSRAGHGLALKRRDAERWRVA